MRTYELWDGVAFHSGQLVPDGRNRLARNIVEICGPLIEELPGGVIDTVHFSPKEFDFLPSVLD